MAARTKNEALSQPFSEQGRTGLRQFSGYVREEFLRQLTGWRGIRIYREMRDNDPIIGALFFAVERLLVGVDFTVDAGGPKPEDAEAADFVNSCITDTEQSWPEVMTEILTFLQFGWAVLECVYKRRNGTTSNPTTNSKYDDGMIGWRKFAGRAQETLLHWEFNDSDDAIAMVQLLPTGGPLLRVPLAKCLHFRTRLLKGNPEGVSMLRNCYVPWYRKTRIEEIEAIGVERDLCGLPVVWVPARLLNANASADDKSQLEYLKSLARDTVRNAMEGAVFPLAYDKDGKNKLYDFTLLSTGGRRQIDTSQIVDRYDHRITAAWLADFITLGSGTSSASGRGSTGQSKGKMDFFKVAVTSFLDMVCSEFNRKAIPNLLALNQMTGACTMRHGEISEKDVLSFAQAVQAVAAVGFLTPDSGTEGAIRGEIGLPPQQGVAGKDEITTGGDGEATGDNDPADDPPQGTRSGQGTGGLASDERSAARKSARRRKYDKLAA